MTSKHSYQPQLPKNCFSNLAIKFRELMKEERHKLIKENVSSHGCSSIYFVTLKVDCK